MEVSFEQELQSYLKVLSPEQKQSILGLIKSFFRAGKDAARITVEEYNAALDKSVAEVRAGQYTSQEDIERESETW